MAAPGCKSQVTLRYENHVPVGIEAVVLSTQHSDDVSTKTLREAVMEEILKPVLPAKWLDKRTKYHINPTGRFVVGGPVGDCGLTGRKIIVDTYGGFARHGGGAFSGKDPSKVTAPPPTARAMSRRTLSRRASPSAVRCRSPMPSGLRSPPPSWSRPSAPVRSRMST